MEASAIRGARFRKRHPQGPSPFGKLILEAIKTAGITRYGLSKKLELPTASLSAVISGRAPILTHHHWESLCQILGLTWEQLEEAERNSVAIEIGRVSYSRGQAIAFLVGKPAFDLDDAKLGTLVRKLASDK